MKHTYFTKNKIFGAIPRTVVHMEILNSTETKSFKKSFIHILLILFFLDIWYMSNEFLFKLHFRIAYNFPIALNDKIKNR